MINPLLNVVPISSARGSRANTAPEARLDDTLPEDPPPFFDQGITEKRVFKWLRQHGLIKGLHREADGVLVAMLAQAIADALKWQKYVDEHGYTRIRHNHHGDTFYDACAEYKFLQDANLQILLLVRTLRLDPQSRRALVPLNRKLTSDVNRWGT